MVARDQLGMFPIFLQKTVDVLVSIVVFMQLIRLTIFPGCLIEANVTKIPKRSSSSSIANYRPISVIIVLSKLLRCLAFAFCQFVLDD